jgi:hypothetical protein
MNWFRLLLSLLFLSWLLVGVVAWSMREMLAAIIGLLS